MKHSQACPKCAGRKIWIIDPLRVPSQTGDDQLPTLRRDGLVLPLVGHQNPGGYMTRPIGHLAAYVCAACGYSELYADDFENLVADPANGVRLLDGTTAPQGPFR